MAESTEVLFMSEEEYLRTEELAEIRHEYVDGQVFAMSGATEAHNLISVNLVTKIHTHLDGVPCRVYQNDMKVQIKSARSYYYPDLLVTCEPFEAKSVFKSSPVVLVEVLSPSTSAIDRREKLVAYMKISSLKEYIIVHQDIQKIDHYRRTTEKNWTLETITRGKLTISALPNGPLSIPLSEIYKGYDPPTGFDPPFRVKEEESTYSPN